MNEINLKLGKVGTRWQHVFRMAITLLLAATLSGCMSIWKEPVRLGNGEVITVTRVAKYEGAGGIGESCWFCRLYWSKLSFSYEGMRYEWTSHDGAMYPIILDVVNGVPVVVSISPIESCFVSENGGREVSYYYYSLHDGKRWIVSASKPENIVSVTNLLSSRPKRSEGISSISSKEAFLSSHRLWGGKPDHRFEIIAGSEKYCANVKVR